MKVSIIIPIHNEEGNIPSLVEGVAASLGAMGTEYEILLVNDGSDDDSERILDSLAAGNPRLRVIHFRRNFGQTAAIMAGIDHSRGEVLIPMDGDNQNDPADIPALLAKLGEGYDVVSGWRKDRKDQALLRVFPSRVANWIISRISGVKLHDYGCTLKAYRREVIRDVRLYGEMHRFIPVYASWQGARVSEIVVRHRARDSGKSHYGISRTSGVILDLLLIKFLEKYSKNPIHIFGGFGLLSLALGLIGFLLMIYYKLWGGKSFIETPLPTLTVFFLLTGFLAILIGFLSEILMRTYYESQRKRPYSVRRTVN